MPSKPIRGLVESGHHPHPSWEGHARGLHISLRSEARRGLKFVESSVLAERRLHGLVRGDHERDRASMMTAHDWTQLENLRTRQRPQSRFLQLPDEVEVPHSSSSESDALTMMASSTGGASASRSWSRSDFSPEKIVATVKLARDAGRLGHLVLGMEREYGALDDKSHVAASRDLDGLLGRFSEYAARLNLRTLGQRDPLQAWQQVFNFVKSDGFRANSGAEAMPTFADVLSTKRGYCGGINELTSLLGQSVGLPVQSIEYFFDPSGHVSPKDQINPKAFLHASLVAQHAGRKLAFDPFAALLRSDGPFYDLPTVPTIAHDPAHSFVSEHLGRQAARIGWEAFEFLQSLSPLRAAVVLRPRGIAERRNLGNQLLYVAEGMSVEADLYRSIDGGKEEQLLRGNVRKYATEAIPVLDGLLPNLLGTPGEVEVTHILSDLHRMLGNSARHRQLLDQMKQRAPSHPEAIFAFYKDATRRGDHRTATTYRQTLESELGTTELAEPFALFHLEEKKYAEAESDLAPVFRSSEALNGRHFQYLAWAQMGLGRHREAIVTLDHGLCLLPGNTQFIKWRALAEKKQAG